MERVIFFWDRDNKISTVSDFWDASYIGAVNAPQGFKNHDKRFFTKVLYDRTFPLTATSSNSIVKTHKSVRINRHTQYEAGSTTIATGSLKLFVIGDEASAADIPNVDFTARLHFLDP